MMGAGFSVLAAVSVLPAVTIAQVVRLEDRVVITDFSFVEALAVDQTTLYVATRGGLGIFDRRFERWEPPVTPLDGYPTERVIVALADPADGSVWLGTVQRLVHYEPRLFRFEEIVVPGGVGELMLDRNDAFSGVYLRTRSGWQFLPRGSVIPGRASRPPPAGRQLRSAGVDETLARYPYAQAMGPLALTDQRMRTHRYTAAAIATDQERVFLGTDGLGVIRFDPLTAGMEPLRFGLLAPSAGAVVSVPSGVWTGPAGPALRMGFTFVRDDLQEYRYVEGSSAGFSFRTAFDALARGSEIWVGTDRGVVRFDPGGIIAQGDPVAEEAYALAQGPSGVWVGTRRGVVFVDGEGTVTRIGEGLREPVVALAAARDTVWIGSARGVGVTAAGRVDVRLAGDPAATPELRATIVALTLSADTVVAATRERLLWRDPATGAWTVEGVISGTLGPLSALAADRGGAWVGGERGIGFFRFHGRAFQFLSDPRVLPAPVRDLAVDREYVWVAMDAGLVRIRKAAILP